MMKKKKTKCLRDIFMSSYLFFFIIPAFVLTALIFSIFLYSTVKDSNTEKNNTLSLLSSRLNATIDSDIQMSLIYIFDSDTEKFYNFLSRKDFNDNPVNYNQLQVLYSKSMSKYMTLLNNNITGVGFIPCNHNEESYFYLPKYKDMEIENSTKYKNKYWFRQLKTGESNIVFYVPDSDENKTFSIIRETKDFDKNKTTGYISVDCSLDFISELMNDITIGKNSGIIIMSPDNHFIYSTNPDIRQYSSIITTDTKKINDSNDSFDVFQYYDSDYGFKLYYVSSRYDLLSDIYFAVLLSLLFYGIIVVSAILLFKKSSNEVSVSVNNIQSTMNRYNNGETAAKCSYKDCHVEEFCMISEDLNNMIANINTHIANEYQLKIAQKTAEYQALQAEVNPHFLYNTLGMFITLNRIGEKRSLERSIISLSHLFRYTCEHNSDSTIDKEFSFISDYLALQKTRYEDRLVYKIYMEPGVENFTIPKLLIQPLVENAIIHSLEPSAEPIDILVSAVTTENKNGFHFIIISVINTGLPFMKDAQSHKRVGLTTIKDRLEIYNKNAFLTISGGIGKPTKCYIIIPTKMIGETK